MNIRNILLPRKVLALSACYLFALLSAFSFSGFKVNTTKSIPVGLYYAVDTAPVKGSYVMFCPPDTEVFSMAKSRGYIAAGFCPGSFGCLMKRISAYSGDSLCVSDEGVFVNGALLPNSKPLDADLSGRPLPRFRINNYILRPSEVLLMSDVSKTSFDGRYYGPVSRSLIKTAILPLITR